MQFLPNIILKNVGLGSIHSQKGKERSGKMGSLLPFVAVRCATDRECWLIPAILVHAICTIGAQMPAVLDFTVRHDLKAITLSPQFLLAQAPQLFAEMYFQTSVWKCQNLEGTSVLLGDGGAAHSSCHS